MGPDMFMSRAGVEGDTMINLSIPKDEQELKPRITVVGIGGAGGNAVSSSRCRAPTWCS